MVRGEMSEGPFVVVHGRERGVPSTPTKTVSSTPYGLLLLVSRKKEWCHATVKMSHVVWYNDFPVVRVVRVDLRFIFDPVCVLGTGN